METRIMFIENKGGGDISGDSRIGRVSFSKSGRTIYYKGKTFKPIKGFKSNYYEIETKEEYWISGCKKNGEDRLYAGHTIIDEDVVEEYWCTMRELPSNKEIRIIRGAKH